MGFDSTQHCQGATGLFSHTDTAVASGGVSTAPAAVMKAVFIITMYIRNLKPSYLDDRIDLMQALHLVQVCIYFYKPFLLLFFAYVDTYISIAIFKTSVGHVEGCKGC